MTGTPSHHDPVPVPRAMTCTASGRISFPSTLWVPMKPTISFTANSSFSLFRVLFLSIRRFPIYQQISRKSYHWKKWQKIWVLVNMSYPDSFPKPSTEISTSILMMQDLTMHVIAWKIRAILLQIFAWTVDLKVRGHLTGYLRKDIKYRRVTIGVHV